ncbi:serine protease [Acuticoccus sp. M5D2P5]|uniref:serine protease n=1 Tax=Acuticoccus kalidii TaxID=2910977 RepID=UPI001F31013D|nr:serine protease [Acuticoccus kalidii]MCF3935714.1 serine protease [Acuticoccus kalidii]
MTDIAILNHILPIIEFEYESPSEIKFIKLSGTGFLLKPSYKLITAKHVLNTNTKQMALQIQYDRWAPVKFEIIKHHPNEDISVIDARPTVTDHPFLQASIKHHNSGGKYHLFGYPEDILFDREHNDQFGRRQQYPDLVYNSGYIRRRTNFTIPGLVGSAFFELSEVAGTGCSGAPIITQLGENWEVSGLYLGERTIENANYPPRELAYALRFDSIEGWLRESGVFL